MLAIALTALVALAIGNVGQAFQPDCQAGKPDLRERLRFPPQEAAYEAMQFNRRYRKWVAAQRWRQLHEAEYWDHVLAETDYLFQCWDWLHAAQGGEGRDEEYWSESLERLRKLLGDEAYFAGAMPPPAPLWRFREI